jgi:hypothetical protein
MKNIALLTLLMMATLLYSARLPGGRGAQGSGDTRRGFGSGARRAGGAAGRAPSHP